MASNSIFARTVNVANEGSSGVNVQNGNPALPDAEAVISWSPRHYTTNEHDDRPILNTSFVSVEFSIRRITEASFLTGPVPTGIGSSPSVATTPVPLYQACIPENHPLNNIFEIFCVTERTFPLSMYLVLKDTRFAFEFYLLNVIVKSKTSSFELKPVIANAAKSGRVEKSGMTFLFQIDSKNGLKQFIPKNGTFPDFEVQLFPTNDQFFKTFMRQVADNTLSPVSTLGRNQREVEIFQRFDSTGEMLFRDRQERGDFVLRSVVDPNRFERVDIRVIRGRSHFFNTFFESQANQGFIEHQTKEMGMQLSGGALEMMVRFIYLGTFTVNRRTIEDALDLLEHSEMYMVTKLEEYLFNQIKNYLNRVHVRYYSCALVSYRLMRCAFVRLDSGSGLPGNNNNQLYPTNLVRECLLIGQEKFRPHLEEFLQTEVNVSTDPNLLVQLLKMLNL